MTKVVVIEHIDHALVEKPRPPMYQMHRYRARKPPNIVAEYIERYSRQGEIVLDPFVGSGVTTIEAVRLGRRAIAVDLDPMAIFITRMTLLPVDIRKLEKVFSDLKEKVEPQLQKYYETTCVCGQKAKVICRIWDIDSTIPKEIRYSCPKCGRKTKAPDKEDIQAEEIVRNTSIPHWYPTTRLYYSDGSPFLKREKWDSIDQLFTKRNLICLSILLHAIRETEDMRLRNVLLFTFTSMVHLASKMTIVRETRPFSSCWARPSFWVPPEFMESHVWTLYENSFRGKQGILRGKEQSNTEIKYCKEARSFADLQKDANLLLLNQSALDLSNVPSESVDYVFTDPPYGGSIQYLELSTLWASWLAFNHLMRYDDEITINESQRKTFDYYHKMLKASFDEVYRVLKSGRWLTVTFHSTDIKVWNSIIRAIVYAGFDLEKIIYQPALRASDKALSQPYGSAVGDYYIRFRKPKAKKTVVGQKVDEARYERVVVETAKHIVANRGEPTPYTHILNGIIPELEKNGIFFAGASRGIDAVLKAHIGKEFVLVPVTSRNGKTSGHQWWFKNPQSIPYLTHVPLHERVEKVVINVLNRKVIASFDDILQEIFLRFPNALTPDTQSVITVLEEYAEKTRDGRWRLKRSVQKRESQHDSIVRMIAELGLKAGFEVHADIPQLRKPLILPMTKRRLQRVSEIDVIWYKQDKVFSAFEVENTTSITEAIVRGSNINYPVRRYIVIPDERENLLVKKIEEPVLKERIEQDRWNFIRYDDFIGLYSKYKTKKLMDSQEIESVARMPRLRVSKTTTIDEFT